MDFSILAKNRYSVRSFKSDAVEEDKIAEILDAGLIAPSACNFQPWRIYVAKSEEARKKLSETLERIVNEGANGLICVLL